MWSEVLRRGHILWQLWCEDRYLESELQEFQRELDRARNSEDIRDLTLEYHSISAGIFLINAVQDGLTAFSDLTLEHQTARVVVDGVWEYGWWFNLVREHFLTLQDYYGDGLYATFERRN